MTRCDFVAGFSDSVAARGSASPHGASGRARAAHRTVGAPAGPAVCAHRTGSAPERPMTQTSTSGSDTARQRAVLQRPLHRQRPRHTHRRHRQCHAELAASEKVPEKSPEIPRKSYARGLPSGRPLPPPSQTRVCTGMTSMPRGRGGASLQVSVAILRHYRPGLCPGTLKKKKKVAK